MTYVLVISPTADRQLDEIISRFSDQEFFDHLDSHFDRLAEDPSSVMREEDSSGVPRFNGHFRDYHYQVAFRFMEDEKRIEILGVKVHRFD